MIDPGPEVLLAQKQTQGVVAAILNDLPKKQRDVLKQRFGLEGPARTLRDIGGELGVCAQRVREIEAKALRALMHPARQARIRAAWLDAPVRRFPKKPPKPVVEFNPGPIRFFDGWIAELKKDPRLMQIGPWQPGDFEAPFRIGMSPDMAAEFAVRYSVAPSAAIKEAICQEYRAKIAKEGKW